MASRRLCGGWTNCAVVYLVQSHAVYTVFTKGYKSKFTYFMRSISVEAFEDYVDPIQEAIDDLLLPTLFGQTEPPPPPLPSDLRLLVTLTPVQRRARSTRLKV